MCEDVTKLQKLRVPELNENLKQRAEAAFEEQQE